MDSLIELLTARSWPEWLGMVTGVLGVWLSIKEKIGAWPLFILCYSSYVYIGFHSGWFAFMGMNVVFIGISIYGWIKWSRSPTAGASKVSVSTTPRHRWPMVALLLLVGTGAIGYLVGSLDGARLPYLDALATCSGFTAQWMLSRKHIETWIFWILTDIIYVGIFATDAAWPSVILFAVFILLAVKGWREWKMIILNS